MISLNLPVYLLKNPHVKIINSDKRLIKEGFHVIFIAIKSKISALYTTTYFVSYLAGHSKHNGQNPPIRKFFESCLNQLTCILLLPGRRNLQQVVIVVNHGAPELFPLVLGAPKSHLFWQQNWKNACNQKSAERIILFSKNCFSKFF